jgi:predicted CXXCH cytochrome family protein
LREGVGKWPVFYVEDGDEKRAEIYLWDGTGQWIVFQVQGVGSQDNPRFLYYHVPFSVNLSVFSFRANIRRPFPRGDGLRVLIPRRRIVTGERSGAKIRLEDESLLAMGEKSRLQIMEYDFVEEEAKRVALFKLRTGRLRVQLSEGFDGKDSSFQIETPSAIVDARGADFIVSITEKGTEVVALKGVVRVRSSSTSIPGEVVLEAGYGITVQPVWVLPEPLSVPDERLKTLIDQTRIEQTLKSVTVSEDEKVAECVECHEETYLAMVREKFVHPGAERDCKSCHVKQAEKVEEIPAEVYAMESLIFLDVEKKTTSVVTVRVKDRAGREALSDEVSFTTLTLTEKMTDDMPPLITNLRVEELRGGVFYAAVVAWDTDKLCTSAVEWGLPGATVTRLFMDDQYTRDHRTVVSGLSEGRQYILRVISKDPFGNTAVSEDLRVETVRPFSKEIEGPYAFPSVEEVSVVKVGKRTALRWKTNIETTAVVALSTAITGENSDDPHFPGFAEPKYVGLYGCLTKDCHEGNIHKELSHPTGTLSWKKFKTPTDLPLVEGSVMLCITCHTPHGGDHIYRLRKAEAELCDSCHLK